ncbi:MAG TPA: asparagine synthetase B [Bacteroidales bacterium]|nr:asparagine synthetase B [Bacteroidales bacterium]HQH18456.1 asparagine synthetase B [Bacteroidales bacterium]HQI46094.1 asparagine synthetase B [Bacteroidales bacterium]
MKRFFLSSCFLLLAYVNYANYIFIPMDDSQKNHLKAYGIAYFALEQDMEVSWLLNYEGGSFMMKYTDVVESEIIIRGVTYQIIADLQASSIITEISDPELNMDEVKLQKAPKIAVYSPPNKQPWDDAVTLALKYAEIPYDVIYDEDVIGEKLPLYDWLHMHHEDFTGQYGKFWYAYQNAAWYKEDVAKNETTAKKLGYDKVSELKLAVVKKIRDFVAGGGYLFSMCSAPDSFDISLAADNVDICEYMFDGDPIDPLAQKKLNFDNCFAFHDFKISTNPYEYEVSNIDVTQTRKVSEKEDLFVLFDFSAKWDPVPTMLCQNHQTVLKGFMGQTTAFNKDLVKSDVLIMGENKAISEARYIHGEYGKGTWTFLGGHDPEDYQHLVGDPPTELSLFPNSPGYRLILNNVLFPAAKKKKQKT